MSPRRGLGRGLSSLIPTTPAIEPEAEGAPTGVHLLSLDEISPNPSQPRQTFAPEALAELAASIREHGLIQPIIVARAAAGAPTPYTIIAGERRWRAAKLAGLKQVPVIIKDATPQAMLELALVENVQRADLNPLEEAVAYETLIQEFGLTQGQVAARVGKSRVAVANTVRLLQLPDEVKQAVLEGQIREGHARALLGLSDEQTMIEAMKLIIDRGLSVRQTEELVRRLNAPAKPAPDDDLSASPETKALEDKLRARLGTKVNLYRTRKGGRIVIHFYSEEELAELYEMLVGDEPL
ncbi:MAG TPA: ParB/RepB/Spo0J family partition protein [Anaerolineae bacterium]|nr:ParB/RepB/Spo0J family partition protein [Caldilineae bacterium]HID33322.1 ParB/RepB/Spo0J family partition protein [Anaerolineae bacterium]HIQ12236.1 ParB/RepB/Spo0J family partition protein [Caldilineales bacterium]